jgi:hypothetical protein
MKLMKLMKRLILATAFLFTALDANSQALKGVCVDETGNSVEYVNIYVKGSRWGSISDVRGRFSVNVPDSLGDGTLVFSHVSFEPVEMAVEEAGEAMTVRLDRRAFDLDKVVITAKAAKKVRLNHPGERVYGTKGARLIVTLNASENIGQIIRLKRKAFVDEVRFTIEKNTYDPLVFRVLLYKEEAGRFSLLTDEPYYVSPGVVAKRKTFSWDISRYNICEDGDIYVRVEPVDCSENGVLICPMYRGTTSVYIDRNLRREYSFGAGIQLYGSYVK